MKNNYNNMNIPSMQRANAIFICLLGSEPFSEEEAEAILKKFNADEGGRYDIAGKNILVLIFCMI